ncbi:hypothetical protein [Hymenobacter bucti]|uniref:Uncharacterized protein n=1 Tax=Hymenobacter bucti TaxID=1844114 RepID=A0ABW4QVQ0_9BACT
MSCSSYFFLGGALLALGGCDGGSRPADPSAPGISAPTGPYYDVRRFLDGQVGLLNARHMGATKQTSLRDNAYEQATVPEIKWADELQIFYQADINKAALRGAYILDSLVVPGQGLRRTYTLRPGFPHASVLRLAVSGPLVGFPQRIEAQIRQNNTLFYSAKSLDMHFEGGQLRTYQVRGVQKLVLFDSLRFNMSARVL